jgi:hypothetical protein
MLTQRQLEALVVGWLAEALAAALVTALLRRYATAPRDRRMSKAAGR